MQGFDTAEGYRIAPMDSDEGRLGDEERHENHGEDFELNPELSSSNTDFGGEDPAKDPEQPIYPSERATMDYHEEQQRGQL